MIYPLRDSLLLCTITMLIVVNNNASYSKHALYISVIEINHERGKNEANLSIKIFANDLEDAFKNAFETEVSLDSSQNCIVNKKMIENYFSNHLKLEVNSSKTVLNFDTCEKNGDSIWLFFQTDCVSRWNEINVKADYLMELFPTQSIILNINNGAEKRFGKFTLGNTILAEKFN